jgi:carbon monoxide dehydrogenase subunit G
MKLDQSFEVEAPIERVWKALIDVEHVAPCLPGAEISGQQDDGTWTGSFTMKIGPTTASYRGTLHMDSLDEGRHVATMHANGTDKRGQGGAKAAITSTLTETGNGGTHVEVVTDYQITGKLARFGRGGMIEDISARLLREFARRLQDSLTDQPAGSTESANAGAAVLESEPSPAAAVPESEPGPAAAPPPTPPPVQADATAVEPLNAIGLLRPVIAQRLRDNYLLIAAALGFLLAILLRRGRRR